MTIDIKTKVADFIKSVELADDASNPFETIEEKQNVIVQTKIRSTYLKNYLLNLKQLVQENELLVSRLDYSRIIDVSLLGTSSERITGKLYALTFNILIYAI